jgi:hypothetical protein
MRIVRGTVTQASPLLVRLDGASAASPAGVVGAAPAAGARVHVLLSGQQLLVLNTADYVRLIDGMPSWGVNGQNLQRVPQGSDMNADRPSGQYEFTGGSATLNAPDASTAWWYLLQFRHGNTGDYAWQVATKLNPGAVNDRVFTRRKHAGTWTPWQQIGGDTGWAELTGFLNGASAYQTGLGGAWTPRYRRLNGLVHLQGLVNTGTTGTVHVATLPAGFRPATGTTMGAQMAAGPSVRRLDIGADGALIFREGVGTLSTGWHSLAATFPQES